MGFVGASAAMMAAVLLWSVSPAASKLALVDLGVGEITTLRVAGAVVIIWSVVLLRRRDISLRRVGPMPFFMGLLEPGLVTLLVTYGVAYTSAVNAAVVWGLMPLTQPVLGRLVLSERIHWSVGIGAVLAIAGTALLFLLKQDDGTGSAFGDGLLVAGVLCAGLNQLIARRAATRLRDPLVVTAYQLATSAMLVGAFFAVTAPLDTAFAGITESNMALLGLLVLTTAGPFFFYNVALQHMGVGAVSLFAPLVGPLGAALATWMFGEAVTAPILGAIGLVMLGAMLPPATAWYAARTA